MVQITPPNYTLWNGTAGLDDSIIGVAGAVTGYIPMLLVFVWFLVFLGGISSQSRRRGFADIPVWSALASLSTFLVTMILAIKPGLVNPVILGVVLGLTIMTGVWAFLSNQD